MKKSPKYQDPIRYKTTAQYESKFKGLYNETIVKMMTDLTKKLFSFVK